MNIKVVTILFSLSVFAITVSAQNFEVPIRTRPVETTFTQDSVLFSELLSEFATRCQKYDTLFDAVWVNNPYKISLNSKYEKILPAMPLFEIYPAFRIDCPDGYVLGIYNVLRIYNDKTKIISYASYLDILSYTSIGGFVSRLSLVLGYLNSYAMHDSERWCSSQITGTANIMNGEILYEYTQIMFIDGELTTRSESTYVYKIQDDATLKFLSVEHKQD